MHTHRCCTHTLIIYIYIHIDIDIIVLSVQRCKCTCQCLVLVTLPPSGAGCRSKRCDTLNHQLTEQRDKAQHEGMTVLAARHWGCKVSLTCVSTVRPPSNLCHVDRFLDDFQMISMPEPNINTDTVLPICNPSPERRTKPDSTTNPDSTTKVQKPKRRIQQP